jgi:hypothetical protein
MGTKNNAEKQGRKGLVAAMHGASLDRGGKDKQATYKAFVKVPRNMAPATRKLNILPWETQWEQAVKSLSAPVIEVDSFEDLECKKDRIRGTICFYNYKFNETLVSPFQGLCRRRSLPRPGSQ